MSGSSRPRKRDLIASPIRRLVGRPPNARPIPPPASQTTAPLVSPQAGARTTAPPSQTQNSSTPSQRFLDKALNKLASDERETIRRHLPANTRDVVSAVDQAYVAAQHQQQVCESNRWRFHFGRNEVVLRDEAGKVLRWLDRFKSVGDVVANVDPLHVGLPWAGIRLVLEAAVSESRQMAALLDGMNLTLSMTKRLEAYFGYYQHLPAGLTTDNLEKALIELYAFVLDFIATAIQTYEKGTTARTWRALWETSTLEDSQIQCEKLANRTEIEASNCDRALAAQDRQKASHLKTDLNQALQRLDDIPGIRKAVQVLRVKVDLAKLKVASGATYDSHEDEHAAKCLQGTRTELLARIATWVDDSNGKSIFWLCGKAGTGKSTISRTIADMFYGQNRLGASFFFKRGEANRGNASRFFPTLAIQLADRITDFGESVAEALDADSLLCDSNLQKQCDKLLSGPLAHAATRRLPAMVIVIDALDECDPKESIATILRLLARVQSLGLITLRIFVTSRPELPIQIGFKTMDGHLHQDVMLEEVQAPTIEHDLRMYLKYRFDDIRKDYALSQVCDSLPADWPGDAHIEALVNLATPLFIFAFTVCRYVSQRDPRQRLHSLIQNGKSKPLTGLSEMYLTILDRMAHDQDDYEYDQFVTEFREVVGSIVLLAEPLSAVSLADLLGINLTVIDATLRPLHSVLHIPDSSRSPIRLLHLSFRDFLVTPAKKSNNQFYIDEMQTHRRLAEQCLQRLSQSGVLSNDLCKVVQPGTRRSDVSTDRVAEHILPDVAYACSYWAWHIIQSEQELYDNDQTYQFLQQHILHWLEALAWLGRLSSAIGFVSELKSQAQSTRAPRLLELLNDAGLFLQNFRYIIDIAPLQLYYSALAFAPMESIIRDLFPHAYKDFLAVLPKAPLRWNTGVQLEGHTSRVNAVAFSPDGSTVVSGSDDKTVRLWDVSTGEERQRLEHDDEVNTVAFSPDGSTVVSGSDDRTARLWDVSTGEERQRLEHDGMVFAVAFSPDGSTVVSGSSTGILRIWDVSTYEAGKKLEHRVDQSSSFFEVSPPDWSIGASTKEADNIVRLKSVSTSEVERQERGRHDDRIVVIAFSPDGSTVASGSWDKTVRLWNVSTGEELHKLVGHYGVVEAVAFSPDGSTVASGSWDRTVRLWKVSTGEERQRLDHDNLVRAVAFSPDGSTVVSGSGDKAVRLWKVSTGEELQKLLGHEDWVYGVAFSPDGSTVASGSGDKTVRLWKVSTGEEIHKLVGHDGVAEAVAFSPDGSTVVWGSRDQTVRLRTAPDWGREQIIQVPGPVQRLAFSKDGRSLRTDVGEFSTGLARSSQLPTPTRIDLYPGLAGPSGQFVRCNNHDVLWLPPEYRGDLEASAVYEDILVIGGKTGEMFLFKCR